MELLKHELFKLFMKKSLLFTLIAFILFLATIFLINSSLQKEVTTPKELIGPITEGKLKMIEEKWKVLNKKLGDNSLSTLSPAEQKQFFDYYSFRSSGEYIVKNKKLAPEQVKADLDKLTPEDGYAYKAKKLEYDMISNVPEPSYENNHSWKRFISNYKELASICIVVYMLLGLSSIFSEEYATGMANFISSSKNGKKIVTAKLLVSIIFIIFTTVVFTLIIGLTYFIGGATGGETNLQSFSPYLFSPFHLQLWEYFIFQFFACLVGSIAFGMVVLLLSVITRSSMLTFFIGLVIFEAPLILDELFGEKVEWIQTVTLFGYNRFVSENLIVQFKAFNIFGTPVLYPYVALVVLSIVTAPIIWLSYNRFRQQSVS